jgi:conjugal transfer mating pair stabilization protein TraG
MTIETMTVYAYGNVDALYGIFNAVAMVMSSDDFKDMIRVAVVIGFAVVATLAALPGNLSKSWNWFLAVTVLTSALLVPKADVSIVDKLGHQATRVVSNVPWTLALLASVKSSIGATLTGLFETAFQTIPAASVALPAALTYQEHGMMFGSRLVQKSREADALSVYAKFDLVQYIRNCIFPVQGASGSADAMETSTDLKSTFAGMNNKALSSSYHDAGVLKTESCDAVWTAVSTKLNAAGAEAVRRAALQALPDLYKTDSAVAVAKVEASLEAIYNKAALAGAAASASQILQQNILINATAEASALYGASLNDPSTMLLASMRTQAVQQANAGNTVQGRMAEETLPIVRNITEGILYATFPLLCILLVASEAKALGALFKSYVYVLIWVELWPPMFAVVNYLQTLEAAKTLEGAAFLTGGATGLTLGTASSVFSTSVSTLATTSWMVTFVPVLAAAVLFGFDKILAITGAAAGGQRAAQSEAAQATKGNMQAGNVSFDQQQLAAYRSDPAMYRTESVGGVEFRNAATGLTLGQYRSATAPVSLSDTAAITRGMATEASASVTAAQRFGKAAEKSLDAAFTTALGAAQSNSAAASRSLGWDVTKVGSNGIGATDVNEEAKKIAESHGIKDASMVAKALTAGTSGLPIPVFGAMGKTEQGEQLTKDVTAGVDRLQKLGAQRKTEMVDQFRHGEGFEEVRRSNRDATQRVESSAREAQSYRESEQSELGRSQQLSAKIEGAERFARDSSANWANLLDQHARTKFGMSVHDGVADPRRWQEVVRSFINDGQLVQGDDGRMSWIPPDRGLGPQAFEPSLLPQARTVAAGGAAGLVTQHEAAKPGGGRRAVTGAGEEFDATVRREQDQYKLRPDAVVSDGGLKVRVATGQGAAAAVVAATLATTAKEQGAAQLALTARGKSLSGFHRPAGSGTNAALNAATGADGRPQPFDDEGRKEQQRRDDAAKKFYRDAASPNAAIPTVDPNDKTRR